MIALFLYWDWQGPVKERGSIRLIRSFKSEQVQGNEWCSEFEKQLSPQARCKKTHMTYSHTYIIYTKLYIYIHVWVLFKWHQIVISICLQFPSRGSPATITTKPETPGHTKSLEQRIQQARAQRGAQEGAEGWNGLKEGGEDILSPAPIFGALPGIANINTDVCLWTIVPCPVGHCLLDWNVKEHSRTIKVVKETIGWHKVHPNAPARE